ncbi:hypothetical protein J4462_01935 [Candidatus Pacearchaeota archaeon]|nr:hypothetical protein [Candidatus Pacearchaeota archaeon]
MAIKRKPIFLQIVLPVAVAMAVTLLEVKLIDIATTKTSIYETNRGKEIYLTSLVRSKKIYVDSNLDGYLDYRLNSSGTKDFEVSDGTQRRYTSALEETR